MRKHNIKNKNEIPTVIKKLKQQLQAKTQSSSTRTKLFKTKKTPKKKIVQRTREKEYRSC